MKKWFNKLDSMSKISSEPQGLFLKRALRCLDIEPRIVVEIGVYQGVTAAMLRSAFPQAQLLLIDPWKHQNLEGRVYVQNESQEKWDMIYESVCRKFQDYEKVIVIREFSYKALDIVADGSVDLLFIDGDHVYRAIKKDIELWLPKVSRPGIISGHDYSNKIGHKGVKRAVDQLLSPVYVNMGKRRGNIWVHYVQE